MPCRRAPVAAAIAFMATAVLPAHALDWDVEPSVSASAIFTDNANQSANDPESAFILNVRPGVSLRSKGSRRVQAGMRYALSGVARFGEDNSTDLNHSLGATGKAELVEDFLFIDGNANVSQELISLIGAPGDATVNPSNRATVGTYSVSPYIVKRLGTFAQAQARYTTSGALFQNNAANDINSNAFSASLASGTRFVDLSWGLNYSLRDATVSGGQDYQLQQYGANAGYRLTRHVRVFGSVGYDENDYASSSGSDISGRSWSLGLGWAPTRRTSMDASFGDSYFGRTYGFNLRHRTRHSAWTASYSEGTSDISQLILNNQPIVGWQCDEGSAFNTSVLPPEGLTNCTQLVTISEGSVPLGIANGIFISKTLRGAASWTKGKSGVGLNVYSTRRQFRQLVGLPEDETRGIVASFNHRLDAHTNLNASLGLTNIQVPAGLGTSTARDDDLYTASLGVTHQFSPKLSGAVTVRRQQRESNDPTGDFDENRITATVSMRF